jgi:purine-binding chemotaxis protein CheW
VIGDRAGELAVAFDRGFAEAAAPPESPRLDLLRIRLGGEPYALVLSEIAALQVDVQVSAVPTPRPELLGVASVRGAIVPIYDLRLALGVAATGAPRWIVMLAGTVAGLAFDGFDGHARIAASELAGGTSGNMIRGAVDLAGVRAAVVNLDVIATLIRDRWNKENG